MLMQMKTRLAQASMAAQILLLFASLANGEIVPENLRCEYLTNPAGIDIAYPRLSWVLVDGERIRGQKQTAYQVLAASSPELLEAGVGDLWGSGRVASEQSVHVPYAGKELRSHQTCWWKVRVWDKDGQPSRWSDVATWSMGILADEEWGAKWIGHTAHKTRQLAEDEPGLLLNFDGCRWMWAVDPQPLDSLPKGNRFFRTRIVLPKDSVVEWAYLLIAADDRYWLSVNGKRVSISRDEPNAWRQGYEVDLSEKLHSGEQGNVLALQINNREVGPAGVAGKLVIRLSSGDNLVIPIDETWKSSIRGGINWQQPEFDDSKWPVARALAAVGDEPWGIPKVGYAVGWLQTAPSPVLRKTFLIEQPVRRATAYVAGLGYYELRLNGAKVGDHVLDPAFTRYDRRVLYSTYDVTDHVRQGGNALGMMLGNGWYNMHTRATWDFDQAPWRGEPRMLLHLRLELADGSVRTVASDATWKASTGPIVLDSIRAGEVYDARQEIPGWDTPEFDDADWATATLATPPGGVLSAQMIPPLRITETIRPVSVRETRPGVFLFDLGQNIAGWARLCVRGPSGTKVTLRYSERAREDGSLDREEIGKFIFAGPFQQDTYILKGGGREVWQPRFVYHGFQYVEVTGFPGRPTLDDLQGLAVHTDFEPAGEFRCANALLNRIQKLTRWSFRNNFHGYPTDCPQREKNGWTGDAHLAAEQALLNWRSAGAYTKWMNDIRDEQRDSGEIAAIVPTSGWGYAWGNGPAWDSAYVLIPWYVYQYRGDRRILEANYESMRRYVDYVASRSPEHIADFGLGDWAPADTETPRDVTSTGYFYVDAVIVAQAAALQGLDADVTKYSRLAEKIRAAFNRKFYQGDGNYAGDSQTALSCALYQGLTDSSELSRVVERLVAAVHAKDDHLDVGILGAKYLFRTLSDNGHHELAYRIATQTTPPGYGHWVEQGATTLWEHWDGHSSLDHIMFGDISAWMIKFLAGIRVDPQQPGFKHVILRPLPPADLAWAEARHDSMYGPIQTRWEKDDDRLLLKVSLPPNTTATVALPAIALDGVTESGKSLVDALGVSIVDWDNRIVDLQSGRYHFDMPRARKP